MVFIAPSSLLNFRLVEGRDTLLVCGLLRGLLWVWSPETNSPTAPQVITRPQMEATTPVTTGPGSQAPAACTGHLVPQPRQTPGGEQEACSSPAQEAWAHRLDPLECSSFLGSLEGWGQTGPGHRERRSHMEERARGSGTDQGRDRSHLRQE